MKIIFDIGANKGQNFNYFFDKADIVIAFEANKNLVKKIESNFKQFIDNKKLVIENVALTNDRKTKEISFYISKENDVESTLYPDDENKFYKQDVRCETASLMIKKYLKKYNISEIEYIKLDIEGSDHIVLEDLLKNNILAKNLSVECHEPEVIELLLNSPYKSFKFIEGGDFASKKNIEIWTKNKIKKIYNFNIHSSGPYGDDIPGDYFRKNSILPYFLNKGLGWRDIHCSLEIKDNLQNNISYLPSIHSQGFRYHLEKIIPSLINMIKNRINKLLKKI